MVVWSRSRHLSHVRTGLTLLARQGSIRLSQEVRARPPAGTDDPAHLRDARDAHMQLVLDGALHLYIDAHDSWELDSLGLAHCDLYFKRSLAPAKIPATLRDRVQPLGLYYRVYPGGFDRFEAVRERAFGQGLVRYAAASVSARFGVGRYAQHVARLCAPPDFLAEPRVLFMTQVWEPAGDDRSAEKADERRAMNELRAECVVRLRRELGSRFVGGLRHSGYARRYFPHALLEENGRSERGRYLAMLRGFPICVATTGLHGSIGAKMGEYVAFSKAIVSEPLHYQLPGEFRDGSNYLGFSSADACVERIGSLIDDAGLRRSMMQRNWSYYRSFVRPDELVRNALALALGRGSRGSAPEACGH